MLNSTVFPKLLKRCAEPSDARSIHRAALIEQACAPDRRQSRSVEKSRRKTPPADQVIAGIAMRNSDRILSNSHNTLQRQQ
jgi:hypothetical protein